MGFSLQWLLMLWSTSSRACGLQYLPCIGLAAKHVGSSWTKDRTSVLCIDRQIHRGKLYIIFHTDIVSLTDSDPWPGLPWSFSGKTNKQTQKLSAKTGDLGSIPGLGWSPWVGNGNLLQYSCLGNSMDRGAWHCYSSWGGKELDATLWLNNSNNNSWPWDGIPTVGCDL